MSKFTQFSIRVTVNHEKHHPHQNKDVLLYPNFQILSK